MVFWKQLFGGQKTIAGNSRYLLPGRNPNKLISNNTLLFALYRLGYKGKMTGHGFQAVASTILNESGFNPDAIERQFLLGDALTCIKEYDSALISLDKAIEISPEDPWKWAFYAYTSMA